MKRIIPVILCIVLLFGMLPQVHATETSSYATIQYITEPSLSDSYRYSFFNDTEGILYGQSTFQRVSVFGEPLGDVLDSYQVSRIYETDALCYLSRYMPTALFNWKTGEQLSEPLYDTFRVVGNYVQGEKGELDYDYFTMSGKKMPTPNLPSNYEVGGFLTDNLICAGPKPKPGNYRPEYYLYTVDGKRLSDNRYSTVLHPITDQFFTEGSTIVNTEGQTIGSGFIDFATGFEDGGFLGRGNFNVYRYSADGKILWSHAVDSHYSSNRGETYIFFGKYVFITSPKNECAYMIDENGEQALPGTIKDIGCECFHQDEGTVKTIPIGSAETPLFYTLSEDQVYTVYNLELEPVLTLPNYRRVTIGGGYVLAVRPDGDTEIYDVEGHHCGDLIGSNYSIPAYGLLYSKRGSETQYAIYNMQGDRVTEARYDYVKECGAYGLLLCIRDGGGYLVNASGEELNEKSLQTDFRFGDQDEPFFVSHYGCYAQDGKIGILRYVEPGEGPFADVLRKNWFSEAVEYCYDNGLMNGVGVARFNPSGSATRAMLVQVLYNYAGQKPESDYGFTDVEQGRWYTDAINWAAENGIVNGTGDTTFSPNKNITREQIVTILYRFAEKNGMDVSARDTLEAFPDAASVSRWATDAMQWAVDIDLITGKSGKLVPNGIASRAEIATILMRFTKMLEEAEALTPIVVPV